MSENIQPSSDDKQIVENLTKGVSPERSLEINNKELSINLNKIDSNVEVADTFMIL